MITSTANDRIRSIRALQRRKHRESTGHAYVEGIRAVIEAIRTPGAVETLIVAPDLLTSTTARDAVADATDRAASGAGLARLEVSAAVFRSLSNRDGPQGLAAVIRQRWDALKDVELEDGDRWVALASVADPGNLGTILSTCAAADAAGVIVLERSADPYTPTAMRASTGAVFGRRLVRADWPTFARWARTARVTIVGATDDADTSYRGADYGSRSIVLMGGEREGLTAEQRALCDRLVAIPMRGDTDSLNLAVATSLILYEVLDQREQKEQT